MKFLTIQPQTKKAVKFISKLLIVVAICGFVLAWAVNTLIYRAAEAVANAYTQDF